jgi:hypothetical protein
LLGELGTSALAYRALVVSRKLVAVKLLDVATYGTNKLHDTHPF